MATSGSTPKLLLVIEDDPNDAFLLERAFDRLADKCVLQVCRNLTEAKCYLDGSGVYADRQLYRFPDAIVSDLKIGTETGLDFFRWLRAQPKYAKITCILMSGSTSEEMLNKTTDIPDISIREKPLTFENLLRVAEELCAEA